MTPEPLGEGGPALHYCMKEDDAFALSPRLVKTYSRRQLTTEERMVVEKAFGILVSRFRVILCTMEQRPKVVRDIVLTCVVLHNILRTHQGGVARTPTPPEEVAAVVTEPGVYVADESYKIPQWRQSYSKTYSWFASTVFVHWLGRGRRSEI